ncbi:MAG: hypothetical protein ACI8P9_005331 [Parasphingorhabdus sp.]|jgi:hypothetical protein
MNAKIAVLYFVSQFIHSIAFSPKISMKKFFPIVICSAIIISFGMAGCSSSGAVVADPAYGKSGKKHYGKSHKINLFGRSKKSRSTAGAPSPTDPEYQEYLDWKKWKEFQEYQEWKKNNPDAVGQEATSQS